MRAINLTHTDVRRIVNILDRLIPWAVRGAVEHPYNSGIGLRIINQAVDLRRDLTGQQRDMPRAAELEQTELDLLKKTVEEQAERLEWTRGIIAIARNMLVCRSAGHEDDSRLYHQMEDLINNPPRRVSLDHPKRRGKWKTQKSISERRS